MRTVLYEIADTFFQEQITRLQQNSNTKHDFSVFWVPRRTLFAQSVLEQAGILGDINVGEFRLFFQPLENDLLSLELDDSFGELYLASVTSRTVMASINIFERLAKRPDVHIHSGSGSYDYTTA